MRRQGMLTDRGPLIEALERETGEKAVYSGPPTFRYTIGPHSVLRDGSLECDDEELVERLVKEGLVKGSGESEGITIPLDGFTGKGLMNLVNMVAAKERYLNKLAVSPGAFHVEANLLQALKDVYPQSVAEFMDAYHKSGGEKALLGLAINGNQVAFTGFPDTPACRVLAERMAATAEKSRWIKSVQNPAESEKYTVRVWLNQLGMRGAEYKDIRKEILDHFEGNASFSTLAARDSYYERRRPKKEEPDFIPLE